MSCIMEKDTEFSTPDLNDTGGNEFWETFFSYTDMMTYATQNHDALGQDVMISCPKEVVDWETDITLKMKPTNVVLRDRLMTDAALGGPKPIKTEHNYSLTACSPPRSTDDDEVDNPQTHDDSSTTDQKPVLFAGTLTATTDHQKLRSRIDVTDMEEECFPAISMNTASGRESESPAPIPMCTSTQGIELSRLGITIEDVDSTFIKGEPMSSPSSPCNSHPSIDDVKGNVTMVAPHNLHFTTLSPGTETDEEEDEEEEFCHPISIEEFNFTCQTTDQEMTMHTLPPTPPSTASSDNESNVSASCSPNRQDSQCSTVNVQNMRGFLTTTGTSATATQRLYVSANVQHTPRQPIHTPLISCQPKGSTGMLTLTEEEKRTLIAEGYPIPTKLPLNKAEEKSLKKVRRKIKNKISAQESRRKKKEYMDGLEKRVSVLTSENSSYKERLVVLENSNRTLLNELKQLRMQVERRSSS